jgi:hypothetical protein
MPWWLTTVLFIVHMRTGKCDSHELTAAVVEYESMHLVVIPVLFKDWNVLSHRSDQIKMSQFDVWHPLMLSTSTHFNTG